ncbi:MAG: 4'-phosphopantetheinyl transferase superfamily protein [bacterium]|nr:4'-phosphopantetheinyl transferase superfamily protein [bacterium]
MVSSSAGKKTRIEAGIDILERTRIKKAIKKYGDRFVNRIFTTREIRNFPEKKEIYYSIGFSLKEAFWKTLAPQIQKRIYFDDIEIIWKKQKPEIFLSGRKTNNLEVSLFYNRKLVICSILRHTEKNQ